MKNILITNENNFEFLKERFKNEGIKKIHFLADFDRTLTKAFVNGKSIPSLISILRDENYLTLDYPEKAHALYDKYHAIEIDPTISIEEKRNKMEEWWTLHFELLIASKLNKKDVEKAMESANIALREGAEELIRRLKEKDIPLIILSSSGLGKEAIELYLSKKGLLFDNIHIVSNSFEWDENGNARTVKQPIIHGMNKNETMIKDFPEIFEKVKERKNVILLGDSLSDIEMITGFGYDNLIKIGLLNEEIDHNLKAYQKEFDVVITHDSSMEFILKILDF